MTIISIQPTRSVVTSNNYVNKADNTLAYGGNETVKQSVESVAATNHTNDKYDFTNMSRNEYAQLVKAGKLELGTIIFPKGGIDLTGDTKAQMEAVKDEKINYVDYLKGRIEYRKSIGESREPYQNTLNEILKLHGTSKDETMLRGIDTQE